MESHQLRYILVAASGTGKTTMATILEENLGLKRCITSTTRPPRPGEIDGVHYNFLSRLDHSNMFEYCKFGNYEYGTSWDELKRGDFIILDPQGVDFYRKNYPAPLTVIQLKRDGIHIDQSRIARDQDACFEQVKPDFIVRGETISEMAENLIATISALSNREEELENAHSAITPSKTLPNSWQWEDYPDGSGCLRDPDGKSHFCYDLIPYSSQGSIEYQQDNKTEWSIFPGSLDQFKNHAEQCITQKLHKQAQSLGDHYIAGIMRELANNAWYCREPTTVCISAGNHKIVMEGYSYEPSYECFSATASISLDGTVLYGIDSENVGPYHNEICQIGTFESLEEAISHIKEQTKGCQYFLRPGKIPSFQDRLKNAENRSRDVSSNPSNALQQER